MFDLLRSSTIALAVLLAVPATAQDSTATDTQTQTDTAPGEDAPATGNAEGETPAEDDVVGGPTGLSMGEEDNGGEPQSGQTYVKEVFTDWEMRCVRTEEGNDPCQLYQLLDDQDGNSVAEISIFGLPEGQQAAAGATVITPLETLLTQQVRIQVDSGAVKRYPFTWCSQVGCFSRIGFSAEEVAAFERGVKATLTIVPVAASDQTVNLDISLAGFTAGYDAVNEENSN